MPGRLSGFHSTTILGIRKDGVVAIGGDGQVTVNQTIMKSGAGSGKNFAEFTNRLSR